MYLQIVENNGKVYRNAKQEKTLSKLLDTKFSASQKITLNQINKILQSLRDIKSAKHESNKEFTVLRKELAVLRAIQKLPSDLQDSALLQLEQAGNDELKQRRIEENEDIELEEDIDGKEELKNRVLDPDDAKLNAEMESEKHSQYQGKKSVLRYQTASTESGDKFMKSLLGNYKESVSGDKFLKDLGAKEY